MKYMVRDWALRCYCPLKSLTTHTLIASDTTILHLAAPEPHVLLFRRLKEPEEKTTNGRAK